MKHYIGIDIGGTKCAVSLGCEFPETSEMRVLEKRRIETSGSTPSEVLYKIAAFANEYARKEDIFGIGISCGGPLDSESGIILGPPNLPGWDRVEIVSYFQEKFRLPVYLQNDANACAVAEWRYGAGKGLINMIFLTFGTGMGAGLILNGRLYTGANGMAGEVGHWRMSEEGPVGYGKAGSFEGFCSGEGLARAARDKIELAKESGLFSSGSSLQSINAKQIASLADSGDEFCRSIYADCGHMLGKGMALMIDLLNPQMIVIGSIFARSQNLLWNYAKEEIETEALKRSAEECRVVPSLLGESLGDIAALTVAAGIS